MTRTIYEKTFEKLFFRKEKFATCLFDYIITRSNVLDKYFRNKFTKFL